MIDILKLANEQKEYVTDMRRKFHMCPEPSLSEFETCKMIAAELDSMGVPHRTVNDIGVIADIKGGKEGRCVALRSDHDALEITEVTGLPFASKNQGMMHACGHDAHTAMLLGAVKVLNSIKESLCGNVRIIFQPAEEQLKGAAIMIEAGALDGVEEIFGMHIASNVDIGYFDIKEGYRLASSDGLRIKITGKSSHGARPENGIDAVLVGAALVLNLQSIVAREVAAAESSVVTVGQFHAGTRSNIIAGDGYMDLTVRNFNPEIRAQVMDSIKRIAATTCETYRATCEFETINETAPCKNHPEPTKRAVKVISSLFGDQCFDDQPPRMGSEDFAYYSEKIPAAFAFVGARNQDLGIIHPSHNGKFDLDEASLPMGVAIHVGYVLDFLGM